MRVIHITTIDKGGAYMGALRLHESMCSCGIFSEILVRTKSNADSPVKEINSNFCRTILSKGKNTLNLLYLIFSQKSCLVLMQDFLTQYK